MPFVLHVEETNATHEQRAALAHELSTFKFAHIFEHDTEYAFKSHFDYDFRSQPESSTSEPESQLAIKFETESTRASESKIRLWPSISISYNLGRIFIRPSALANAVKAH